MAEHSAVNRRVVGSSPTCGANFVKGHLLGGFSFFCLVPLEVPRLRAHENCESI